MSKANTPATSENTVEGKNARGKNHVGYIGARISMKQLKRLLATSTPEARAVLKANFLPRYKVRQDGKGTMGLYKEDDHKRSRA